MSTEQLTTRPEARTGVGVLPTEKTPARWPVASALSLVLGLFAAAGIPFSFVVGNYGQEARTFFGVEDELAVLFPAILLSLLTGVLGVVAAVIGLFRGERRPAVQTAGWLLSAATLLFWMYFIGGLMGLWQFFLSGDRG